MNVEDKYIYRCLALARHGAGKVNPNPMVGAVIVCQGRIIGEGYHRSYGGAHAEVNAVNSVRNKQLLNKSTLYVNLEPCSHRGLTPPCTDLILKQGIPRVVVGCIDPFPKVSGRGIDILRAGGVETEVLKGGAAQDAYTLNKEFMTFHTLKRPYIYLKWAQSADGFIDRRREDRSRKPVMFSSPAMLQHVHRRRSEVAAIMVGTRTAILDNPSLTVRLWSGKSPVRVVLDRALRMPQSSHLLDGSVPTLIFTASDKENAPNAEYIRIDFSANVLQQTLAELYERNLTSLLVEGGAFLINKFIAEGLWDEWQAEISGDCLQGGVKAPSFIDANM